MACLKPVDEPEAAELVCHGAQDTEKHEDLVRPNMGLTNMETTKPICLLNKYS